MTTTGLETFDTTVQKTDIWLKEIMNELGWDSRQKAYLALRSVLHTLRDRLTVDEVANLSAQLPMLVRGIYFESWKPSSSPQKYRNREEFLSRVQSFFRGDQPVDAEKIVQAVFTVMQREVTEGEIGEVKRMLPEEIRHLWPEPVEAHQ